MFYNYYEPRGFTSGQHILRIEQLSNPTGAFKRQLCSLTLHEYRAEPLFHWSNLHTSAYRTWRQGNTLVGYRPNNEQCLMRNMTSPRFCDVCLENMWLQFFAQVSLLDNITLACDATAAVVTLNAIPLAQFRPLHLRAQFALETYALSWHRNGVHIPSLDDTYTWSQPRPLAVGVWEARLQFSTPQVRHDPSNLLLFTLSVTIPASGPC